MKKVLSRLLPPGSQRRILAGRFKKKIKLRTTGDFNYGQWIKKNEPILWSPQTNFAYMPLISVITPAFNTPDKYLEPLIESLIAQTYANWELCIVDASSINGRSQAIRKAAQQDKRIKYKKLEKNYGIVGNTNQAIKLAGGEFIGFLDHDDTLAPQALAEVAHVVNQDHKIDLIYSDEDKLSDDGKHRSLPFFKPDWSPDLLLGVNYITHFAVARKKLVEELGCLSDGFDGAQDYELLLRLTEATDKIHHIPKILYHWRLAEGSTAKNVGEKNYADTAGRAALSAAAKRRKIKADILEVPQRPTNYRLKYKLPEKQPLVSIIIPFKDKANLLEQCLDSISKKTTYKNYEIILISNNSQESRTVKYLKSISDNPKIKLFYYDKPFNYAALNNFGRKKSKGSFIIMLNNDTEVITPEWIEELVGVASQPQAGAVGPLLLYPGGTIQHAGVVLGMMGMAGHVFRNKLPEEWTDFGITNWPRNFLAVTGACLAIDAKKYDAVGGLDEKFIMAGNDVALGISLSKKGYRNIFWPFASLIHHENQSVGSYQNAPISDYNHSLTYYRPYLDHKDPYFNPNLDLMSEAPKIRRDYGEE